MKGGVGNDRKRAREMFKGVLDDKNGRLLKASSFLLLVAMASNHLIASLLLVASCY